MSLLLSPKVAPVLMLVVSNVFMTTAWYWHLKYKAAPLLLVILVSWCLALVEYCFAVPANRIGYGAYTAAQLKTIQEVITLVVFVVFSALYLRQGISWNHLAGFVLIAGGAALIFRA